MRAKNSVEELAIFGGPPLFEQALHVGRPNILDAAAFESRTRGALERKWLTNDGPLVLELEAALARFLGVDHCVSVANATLGLQLLIRALGIRGRILMPSFTFIATAHAARWEGATPMFCDVDEGSHTLDPAKVRDAMSREVQAILGVHLWGRPCQADALQAIADDWEVPLIFDAAHALGSSYRGARVGRFGRAEVFSLHATKAINGIEGGFVATCDGDLAGELRAMRNYGFLDYDSVGGLGINAKMNEICAAMALSNLPHFDGLLEHNRAIAAAYGRSLDGVAGVRLLSGETTNHHYAVLRVDPSATMHRDLLIRLLDAENVRARRYFWPGCHRSPPHSEDPIPPSLAVTERLLDEVLQLPTGPQLEVRDAEAIGRCIALCVANAERVTAVLRAA